jgi:tol-pal system protein YbgF
VPFITKEFLKRESPLQGENTMSSHILKNLVKISLTPALLALLCISPYGCGTSEQSTEEWERAAPPATAPQLEYRIDSLTNENRRMKQQLEAMAIENRKITARNAELETKLNESATAPTPKAEAPAAPAKAERAKPIPSTPAPAGDIPSRYSDALQTYRNRNFSAAALQFEEILNSGISEDLMDNCHYWIGQSYYDLKKYKEALPHFETILEMRKSDKKPDAQLMLANCYLEIGNTASAKREYGRFLSTYPNSPYAKKARERLSHLK